MIWIAVSWLVLGAICFLAGHYVATRQSRKRLKQLRGDVLSLTRACEEWRDIFTNTSDCS